MQQHAWSSASASKWKVTQKAASASMDPSPNKPPVSMAPSSNSTAAAAAGGSQQGSDGTQLQHHATTTRPSSELASPSNSNPGVRPMPAPASNSSELTPNSPAATRSTAVTQLAADDGQNTTVPHTILRTNSESKPRCPEQTEANYNIVIPLRSLDRFAQMTCKMSTRALPNGMFTGTRCLSIHLSECMFTGTSCLSKHLSECKQTDTQWQELYAMTVVGLWESMKNTAPAERLNDNTELRQEVAVLHTACTEDAFHAAKLKRHVKVAHEETQTARMLLAESHECQNKQDEAMKILQQQRQDEAAASTQHRQSVDIAHSKVVRELRDQLAQQQRIIQQHDQRMKDKDESAKLMNATTTDLQHQLKQTTQQLKELRQVSSADITRLKQQVDAANAATTTASDAVTSLQKELRLTHAKDTERALDEVKRDLACMTSSPAAECVASLQQIYAACTPQSPHPPQSSQPPSSPYQRSTVTNSTAEQVDGIIQKVEAIMKNTSKTYWVFSFLATAPNYTQHNNIIDQAVDFRSKAC